MKIDLHIHTSTGSDGNLSVEDVFREASKRNLDLIAITDHDSIEAQGRAVALARKYGMACITGVELNVTFDYSGKSVSLDFLGYRFDIGNQALNNKLRLMREHREARAHQIMEKLNIEFDKENLPRFTEEDIKKMQAGIDGALGRPHIADYLIARGIVGSRQEAFDKYLVRCNVPKYPLTPAEASALVRNAGGVLVLAHPNDPNGTSLVSITPDLAEQTRIIEAYMLDYIDGVECWHSRNDAATTAHYVEFARRHHLLMTGGSDCHQKPIILGSVAVPDFVAGQFAFDNPAEMDYTKFQRMKNSGTD
jgi:predicted metal-dependent phosphoesterase TrpH